MTASMLAAIGVAVLLVLLAGLLRVRLGLEREKRRADAAESKSRTYFSVIEVLARSLKGGSPAVQGADQLLDEARRHGLPERELAALGERIASAGGGPTKAAESDARYLFVSFEEEIRRAAGRGEPLTVVTLEAGTPSAGALGSEPVVVDRILRGVAHAVRGQMRGCDTCIRYGAREFILILPGVSREEARQVERRLRTAVQAVTVEPRPGIVLQVRPVLGCATYPDDGGGFDALLTVADLRRSRDASPDIPGGPDQTGPASLPWRTRPVSLN